MFLLVILIFHFLTQSLTSQQYQWYANIFNKEETQFMRMETCPVKPNTLEGPIDINKTMQKFNLTHLVEFYGTDPQRMLMNYDRLNIIPYVNRFVSNLKTDLFWKLWNLNDMSLINDSKQLYGYDGSRIESGNFLSILMTQPNTS